MLLFISANRFLVSNITSIDCVTVVSDFVIICNSLITLLCTAKQVLFIQYTLNNVLHTV